MPTSTVIWKYDFCYCYRSDAPLVSRHTVHADISLLHTHLFSTAEKQQKEVWSSRLQKWLYERFGVYIEDFRFQPEESTVEAEEPLSAKR